jgi:phosphatidylglycerophosphatase A
MTDRRTETAVCIASGFYVGACPLAPGTAGTAVAIPLWWLLSSLPWWAVLVAVVMVIGVGIWAAGEMEVLLKTHDSGVIVIDEIAGFLLATVGVPCGWGTLLTAFLLFRLFDIVKPFPIGWLDRHVSGGLGVLVDDLAAGLATLVLLHGAMGLGVL